MKDAEKNGAEATRATGAREPRMDQQTAGKVLEKNDCRVKTCSLPRNGEDWIISPRRARRNARRADRMRNTDVCPGSTAFTNRRGNQSRRSELPNPANHPLIAHR